MKNVTKLMFMLFCSTFLFTGCTKENNSPQNPTTKNDKRFAFIETALSDLYSESTTPISIDFMNDQLYVGDEDLDVRIFDADFTYRGLVETLGNAPIYAYTLRHKKENGFYIHNQEYNYLMAFDAENHRYAEVNELPHLDNGLVSAIDVDENDNVFLIYDNNTIHKYNSDLNIPLAVQSGISTLVNSDKNEYKIMSIAVDNFQNVYISVDVQDEKGENNDLVLQFDNDLNFIQSIGRNSNFSGPCGIAFDEANYMYVVNRWQSVVKVFNTEFELVATSGPINAPGAGKGQLDEPIGIRINDGKVYITEKNNHRISVYSTFFE